MNKEIDKLEVLTEVCKEYDVSFSGVESNAIIAAMDKWNEVVNKNDLLPLVSGSFLDKLAKPSVEDLKKVGAIREKIEGLIHGSDMHEDIIESLLKPFEKLLKNNGVNLDEADY